MKLRKLIEWIIVTIALIAFAIILFELFQPHIHKSKPSDERKVYFCFKMLSSGAFQYILENETTSASYEELSEYVTLPLPETGQYQLNWEEFAVNKGQKEIRMIAHDGTVFIFDVETHNFSHIPMTDQIPALP